MGYYIPDSRFLEPSLLRPGVKPTGDVEIDWDHPLAKGLQCVVLDGKENLVTGSLSSIGGGTVTYSVPTSKGLSTQFDTDASLEFNETYFSFSQNRTVLLYCFDPSPTTNSDTFFSAGVNFTGRRWDVNIPSPGSPRLRVEIQGGGYTSNLSLNSGDYNFIGCRLDGSTLGDHTLFLNGSSESASGSNTVNTATSNFLINGSLGFSKARNGPNKVLYCYVWDRALSDSQIESIRLDPYQFLKPQGMIWIESATAPGGGYWIPDPRFEEPNLLIPGKKPIGPCVIDWSNNLTEHLKHYWLFPSHKDIAGNAAGTVLGNVGPNLIEKGEAALDFPGGDIEYSAVTAFDGTNDFTVAWRFKLDSTGTIRAISVDNGSGYTSIWFQFSEIGITADDGGLRNASTSFTDTTDWHTFVARKTGTTMEAWLDGVKCTGSTARAGGGTGSFKIGAAPGGSFNFPGKMSYLAIWDKPMPFADRWHLDPYQFLIPA